MKTSDAQNSTTNRQSFLSRWTEVIRGMPRRELSPPAIEPAAEHLRAAADALGRVPTSGHGNALVAAP